MYSWSRKRNKEVIVGLCKAGMNVARLNFSHNTHADHQRRIDLVKEVRDELQLPIAGCPTSEVTDVEISVCSCGSGKLCIKVLGAGCASCHKQYKNAQEAVKSLGIDAEVEYITDLAKVMEYGVMSVPAVVVNDKVVSMGKVLKATEVEDLLHKLGF